MTSLILLRSLILANVAIASKAKFLIFSLVSLKSYNIESIIWYESNSFWSTELKKHLINKLRSSSRMCQLELLFKYGRMSAMKLFSFFKPFLIISTMPKRHLMASYLIIFLLSASFLTIKGMCLPSMALLRPHYWSCAISCFIILSCLSLYFFIQIIIFKMFKVFRTILKF